MRQGFALGLAACWMLSTGICQALDQVEIVLDNSVEMWDTVDGVVPRLELVRNALNAFSFSPELRHGTFVVGLRTVGGRHELTDDEGCLETELVAPIGSIESGAWLEILANLEARGSRPLVTGIEQATDDLNDNQQARRIVVITAGPDDCHRDLALLQETMAQAEHPIEMRFIGLGLGQGLASTFLKLAPTRNVSDPQALLDALRWAILSPATANPRPRTLEILVTTDGQALADAALSLRPAIGGEPVDTMIESGTARLRLPPGRYSAAISGVGQDVIELADILFSDEDEKLAIDLPTLQPVTLEIDPEHPPAGATAYVQYWGAPPGTNWVAAARGGAPVGDHLTRSLAPTDPVGEIALRIPGSFSELEVRFFHQMDAGVVRLIGRSSFSTDRGLATIEAPQKIENGSPLAISWTGPDLPGDYISIAAAEDDPADHVACVATGSRNTITLNAPVIPGAYVIRYTASTGRVLARTHIDVFEILATLEGPQEAAPGEMVAIAWTGPDAHQDYISIADPTMSANEYLVWSPTASGNPSRLAAPKNTGVFEIRYVRAEDGAVLARIPLEIVMAPIGLGVPLQVAAGSRFEVRVTGTAVAGDFVTIAHEGAGPLERMDWSFADAAVPLTLAAPFERGRYEVRYVDGSTHQIVARVAIKVH
jgi:Ca-activated chloride channel family protein